MTILHPFQSKKESMVLYGDKVFLRAPEFRDCSISPNKGNSEIKSFWQDPEFKQDQDAFYYSRVLENPTCRWSTWDAIRGDETPRSDIPITIQERAWSSPIWYSKK